MAYTLGLREVRGRKLNAIMQNAVNRVSSCDYSCGTTNVVKQALLHTVGVANTLAHKDS